MVPAVGGRTVTPGEKLDYLLNVERVTPRISQVVDVDRFKYIWRNHGGIAVGNWRVPMVFGMLSDGSSGVPDRVHDAFWAHDRLYLSPYAYYKGVHRRVSRIRADLIYAQIAASRFNVIGILHGAGLICGAGRKAWRNYRRQDSTKLIQSRVLPKPHCWQFPTQHTRDAVWIGPNGRELSIPTS